MVDGTDKTQDPIISDLVRDDPSFADIVVEFVEGLDNRLATMGQALEAGDFDKLRSAAHQLKGSGGGYGYPALTERAGELEQRAKEEIVADCTAIVDDLKQLCQRVVTGCSSN